MRLSRIILLAAAAAAVAALPCAAHSSDFDKSEPSPPITERSAVHGRDGTAVSQARDVTSGEEGRRLRSSSKAAFNVDEAAECFVRLFPDHFGETVRSDLNGRITTLNVKAVRNYINSNDRHWLKMQQLLEADEDKQQALGTYILNHIRQLERERISEENGHLMALILQDHDPVNVVRILLARDQDLDFADHECQRILNNYISQYNYEHGVELTLESVIWAARQSRRLSVAQTSAGDVSTSKFRQGTLMKAGGQ